MLNCWVQGSGYVMKRACIERLGMLGPQEAFTDYCIRVALAGWRNGWYFPFIHEEHMDDPRSPYCLIKTDEAFMAQRPLSAVRDDVTSLKQWAARVRCMAANVQRASPDPRCYVGWRRLLQRLKAHCARMAGAREPWRV